MSVEIYDDTQCELGEGPLWHPEREQLYWFDIVGKRLLTRENGEARQWQFADHVSAAGWRSKDELLIASEKELFLFNVETERAENICPLDADNPATRSNDGRADPWGGFWIGTMGKGAEPSLGAIYRFYQGDLRKLHAPISIPNAICFAPDRSAAYFTDTPTNIVQRQPLDPETGWPSGAAVPWLDLNADGLAPDGAVTDAAGNVWIAHWGAGKVSAYAPDATPVRSVAVPGRHATCPAFGGDDLTTLFCTSARQGIAKSIFNSTTENGMTFVAQGIAKGRPEPRVAL